MTGDDTPAGGLRITVLGIGTMGAGVARTLLRDGFPVTVWNRNPERARALAEAGAVIAENPRDAVAGADVVLSILFDAAAVESVLAEAAPAVPVNAVWMQCSTIGLLGAEAVAAQAHAAGVTLIEAMMLGTKTPAEQGNLVMLAAGPPAVVERVVPVLESMGQKTVTAGPRVGDASRLKLAANSWIATITAGTAQSLALTRSLGLDPQLFLDAIAGGQSDSVYAHVKGASMLAGDYPPSFALDGLLKDIRLATEAASDAGMASDLLSSIGSVYQRASDAGHGSDDIAGVFRAF